jgi:hypothetical protein
MSLKRGATRATCVIALFAGIAQAEPSASQKALASQLFDDAQQLMAAGNTAEACSKYAESQRQDPQLGTQLYLGECYDRLGKTASAWAAFKDAAETAAARGDGRAAAARAKVSELEAKLPRLQVQSAVNNPLDLEVRLDGVAIGRAAWGSPLPVDPGKHLVLARAAGYKDWSTTVEVKPGTALVPLSIPSLESAVVNSMPVSAPAIAPMQPAPQQPVPVQTQSTSTVPTPASTVSVDRGSAEDPGAWRRRTGWVMAASSLLGFTAGTVFGLKSRHTVAERNAANACSATASCSDADERNIQSLTAQAGKDAYLGNLGFVVGGVLAATGVVLILTAPSSSGSQRTSHLELRSWSGARSGGLLLGGTW